MHYAGIADKLGRSEASVRLRLREKSLAGPVSGSRHRRKVNWEVSNLTLS